MQYRIYKTIVLQQTNIYYSSSKVHFYQTVLHCHFKDFQTVKLFQTVLGNWNRIVVSSPFPVPWRTVYIFFFPKPLARHLRKHFWCFAVYFTKTHWRFTLLFHKGLHLCLWPQHIGKAEHYLATDIVKFMRESIKWNSRRRGSGFWLNKRIEKYFYFCRIYSSGMV